MKNQVISLEHIQQLISSLYPGKKFSTVPCVVSIFLPNLGASIPVVSDADLHRQNAIPANKNPKALFWGDIQMFSGLGATKAQLNFDVPSPMSYDDNQIPVSMPFVYDSTLTFQNHYGTAFFQRLTHFTDDSAKAFFIGYKFIFESI